MKKAERTCEKDVLKNTHTHISRTSVSINIKYVDWIIYTDCKSEINVFNVWFKVDSYMAFGIEDVWSISRSAIRVQEIASSIIYLTPLHSMSHLKKYSFYRCEYMHTTIAIDYH